MKLWSLLALLLYSSGAGAAELANCLPQTPLLLNIHIGGAPDVQRALLIGGSTPALRLVDVESGAVLWSAGATTPVSQRFAAMTAAFSGSIVAVDTDNDGLHDRLYAGDVAGRLWRFDLHNGATADAWASGGVFADFSNGAGRGFRAPADVSLTAPHGVAPWFDIALGTAAPGYVAANNRFYVLRDYAPFNAWTNAQYRDWQALRETDLAQITTVGAPRDERLHAGWFIELGSGEVLTASLTVGGHIVLAVAESTTQAVSGCRSAFTIATLDAARPQPLLDPHGEWRKPLPEPVPTDSIFTLDAVTDADASRALCTFGGTHIADCDVDTHPRRTWWRRADAE